MISTPRKFAMQIYQSMVLKALKSGDSNAANIGLDNSRSVPRITVSNVVPVPAETPTAIKVSRDLVKEKGRFPKVEGV